MVGRETKQMAEFFASVTQRMAKADVDLATIRDLYEPQGVTYAEIDADDAAEQSDHNRGLTHR